MLNVSCDCLWGHLSELWRLFSWQACNPQRHGPRHTHWWRNDHDRTAETKGRRRHWFKVRVLREKDTSPYIWPGWGDPTEWVSFARRMLRSACSFRCCCSFKQAYAPTWGGGTAYRECLSPGLYFGAFARHVPMTSNLLAVTKPLVIRHSRLRWNSSLGVPRALPGIFATHKVLISGDVCFCVTSWLFCWNKQHDCDPQRHGPQRADGVLLTPLTTCIAAKQTLTVCTACEALLRNVKLCRSWMTFSIIRGCAWCSYMTSE